MEEAIITDNKILINNSPDDINYKKEELISKKQNNEEDNYYKLPPANIGFKEDIYENSNIFSKLFFHWGYKILKLTSKYKIESSHLGKLENKNDSKYCFENINYY